MRMARVRYDQEMTYYHLMNRVAGEKGYLPFRKVHREYLLNLIVEASMFYTLELIAVVAMSNHWHVICAAPAELPSLEDVQARWRAYYGNTRAEPDWSDARAITAIQKRMRNISDFCKDVQQRFAVWFNRQGGVPRRGHLWADRFKSTLLEGRTALWEAIKYVELNPVRAGVCKDPCNYRFGTWGRMTKQGEHPLQKNLVKHLRLCRGITAEKMTDQQVVEELRADMVRVMAEEFAAKVDKDQEVTTPMQQGETFFLTVNQRVRYWSEGAVIGCRQFVYRLCTELRRQSLVGKQVMAVIRASTQKVELYAGRTLRPCPW